MVAQIEFDRCAQQKPVKGRFYMRRSDYCELAFSLSRYSVMLGETALASSAVIQHRWLLIETGFRNPFAADVTELSRMVTEKVAAFSNAGIAWWLEIFRTQFEFMARAPMMMAAAGPYYRALPHMRSIVPMSGLIAAGTKALTPVHNTVVANQRRLMGR